MKKHNVFPVDYEGATIMFKNFSGIGSKYNKEGDRNFTWVIDNAEMAKEMYDDGWNIKVVVNDNSLVQDLIDAGWDSVKVKPNINHPIEYRLLVSVNFNTPPNIPPVEIYTYTNGVESRIYEDTVSELDGQFFQNADITVRPRRWQDDKNSEWKIKAYLKEARITLEASRWADKYAQYAE